MTKKENLSTTANTLGIATEGLTIAELEAAINEHPETIAAAEKVEAEKAAAKKKEPVLFDEAGKDPNWKERQEKLAKIIGYVPNCMEKKEYDWWTEYLKRHNPRTFGGKDIFQMVNMHHRLFKQRPQINGRDKEAAAKTLNIIVTNINIIYDSYGQTE